MTDIITGERISELVFEILGWQVKKSESFNISSYSFYSSLNENIYFSERRSNSKYGWHIAFEVKKETINRDFHIKADYFRIKTEKEVKKILRNFKKLNAISKTSVSNEKPKDFI